MILANIWSLNLKFEKLWISSSEAHSKTDNKAYFMENYKAILLE